MLEEIIQDNVQHARASNQPIFRVDINYDQLADERHKALAAWVNMSSADKAKYANQQDYEEKNSVINLKDPDLIPAKNLSILRKEVTERINSRIIFQLLPIDTLDFDDSLIELSESVENIENIRDLYKIRKITTGNTKNAGISADEAARIKNCFSQGRELFLSGRNGSLMVKPLNFFYSLTAYTYGVIILNNPLRYRKDMLPGSHGMSYLPDVVQAQFGGDSPRGTFSDLVTAFPTHLVKTPNVEFNIDCTESVIEFYQNRYSVSLGTLLSMVPEMNDYYRLTTGRNSRCFPLEIVNANDPRSLAWEFHIGDGEIRPSIDSIDRDFKDFARLDRHGKYIVTVPAAKSSKIKATIYTDIRGKLWYIDNPFFPIIMPEIGTHFLISSMFSNIMRYRPDEWGSVLLNEVNSDISLLTRHYFSTFQKKFLLLTLRAITKYIPYAA